MAKIIAVCGKICSGKTHYADSIKEKENAVILSCDEVTKDLFDNALGEKHDEMTVRIRSYLMKKAAELAEACCTVILDWGFWRLEDRKSLSEFFAEQNIRVEWHYIDTDDKTWRRNISERNARIASGKGGWDYFLDEGLMKKLINAWEAPSKDEMDVWYSPKRD